MLRAFALALFCGLSSPVTAQDLSSGQILSPILLIEPDALYSQSLFGKRILAEYEIARADLARRNRDLEAELTEEVQALAQLRPTIPVAEFELAATAFDEKVEAIRLERDAEERALPQIIARGRAAFFEAVSPVLAEMMQAANANIILDRRSVLISLGTIDITLDALSRIDATIGDGLN